MGQPCQGCETTFTCQVAEPRRGHPLRVLRDAIGMPPTRGVASAELHGPWSTNALVRGFWDRPRPNETGAAGDARDVAIGHELTYPRLGAASP